MKQKVGLLVDSYQASKQLYDFIKLSEKANNYEVTTLIINKTKLNSINSLKKHFDFISKRGLIRFVNKFFFAILSKLEKKIICKKLIYKDFFNKYDLTGMNFDVINVYPNISESGISLTYDDEDLKKIKEANINLLVRGGKGILRGEILSCCPNGIISFHHADNDVNRGGPAGFWEVYKQEPRTGFIIQRLKEQLDGGEVLYKGFIRTEWYYSLNKAKLYEVSSPFLHKTIEEITGENSALRSYPKRPYSESLFTSPSVFQIFTYLITTAGIFLYKKVNQFFGRAIRWNVAYQFTELWQDSEIRHSVKIPNPKNRFLADPFLVKRNNKHYCFVEDFDYSNKQGSISVYEIDKDGHKDLGKALVEDFHLAYPFIFEYEGELYMCPETQEKGDIRLYKCVDFPLKWEFERTIMENVSAVDSCIIFHEDKWWLFSNMDYSIVGEHFSQLHIFHNSSPISNNWIPHKNNPVIFDPLKARNGGFIIDKSKLYRIYQRQAFNLYGRAFGVAEIKSLRNEEYIEESLYEVEPRFFPGITGTHTFNYSEGLLVLDYAKTSIKKTGLTE